IQVVPGLVTVSLRRAANCHALRQIDQKVCPAVAIEWLAAKSQRGRFRPRWPFQELTRRHLVVRRISRIAGLGGVHELQATGSILVSRIRSARNLSYLGGSQVFPIGLGEAANSDASIEVLVIPEAVLAFLDCAVGVRYAVEAQPDPAVAEQGIGVTDTQIT